MSNAPPSSHATSGRRAAFGAALIVQTITVLIVLYGDIGFDKLGRSGLAFEHLIILAFGWFTRPLLGY